MAGKPKKRTKSSTSQSRVKKNPKKKVQKILKLDNWIEDKILQGWSDDQIMQNLLKQGWAKDLIELSHRRVLRKFNDEDPTQEHVSELVHRIRRTFGKEEDAADRLVKGLKGKRRAEAISKLDNWIEDKMVKGWSDHKIKAELLKQGWAHDLITQSQENIVNKTGEQPKEAGAISQFVNTIRKTFKKEENLSEKLIDEISQESEEPKQKKTQPPQDRSELVTLQTQVEKINAQLTTFTEFRRVINERFLKVAEETGSLRGNIIAVEKDIKDMTVRISKAVDLVEAVQPQALYGEVKKTEVKLQAQSARIDSNKALAGKLVEEMKDIRKKLGVVRGVEQIMKLHEEVGEQHKQVRKMNALAEQYADKVENMFIELKKRFTKFDTFEQMGKNMEEANAAVIKELQKMKSKEIQYITQDDFQKSQEDSTEAAALTMQSVTELKEKIESLESGESLQKLKEDFDAEAEGLKVNMDDVKKEIAHLNQRVLERHEDEQTTQKLTQLHQEVQALSTTSNQAIEQLQTQTNEAAEITMHTVNDLKSKVEGLQSSDMLEQIKQQLDAEAEGLHLSLQDIKKEVDRIHQQIAAQQAEQDHQKQQMQQLQDDAGEAAKEHTQQLDTMFSTKLPAHLDHINDKLAEYNFRLGAIEKLQQTVELLQEQKKQDKTLYLTKEEFNKVKEEFQPKRYPRFSIKPSPLSKKTIHPPLLQKGDVEKELERVYR